ncbi:MAG: polysaccharide biosynthesis/export family protein, partial [Polaromonas sp.]
MFTFSSSHRTAMLALVRWPALALLAAWLTGCAYAPGLFMGDGVAGPDPQANPYSITTQRATT